MADVENEDLAIRYRIQAAMKAFRASRGWSQVEMAEYLGVSVRNYESYERPSRGVPSGVISRFCRYSGTDIEWIMYGTVKKEKKTAG